MLDMVVIRFIFAIVLTITAYYFQPFGLPKLFSAIYGVIASAAINHPFEIARGDIINTSFRRQKG